MLGRKRLPNHCRILLSWALVLGWMGLIFWVSSIPDLPGPQGTLWDAILKKSAHLCEYAVLAALLWWALSISFSLRPFRHHRWALMISFLYAASDEFHQAFVPGRTARLFDWGIDTLGALAMLGAIKLVMARNIRHKGESL